MAFVSQSALATGSTSVTPAAPASIVSGNVLVAFITARAATAVATTLSGSTTGWTRRASAPSGVMTAEIWDKTAVGSDTMPTWNEASGLYMDVQVAQFSSTVVFDQAGTTTSATSPKTATASGVDGGTGRAIVAVRGARSSASVSGASTDNVNGLGVGTGVNIITDNSATSSAQHTRSIYVTTAVTGSVADADIATWAFATNVMTLCIASYAVAAATVLRPPPRIYVVSQAVSHSSVF